MQGLREHRLVLGQTKVSDKSNEITAIPALLEMLDISGCIITIDAMGTQKSIAQKIIAASSDYILSLKDNHPILHQQVKNWFETAQSLGFKDVDVSISQPLSKGHHRIENRKIYTLPSVTTTITSWTTSVGRTKNSGNGSAFDSALE